MTREEIVLFMTKDDFLKLQELQPFIRCLHLQKYIEYNQSICLALKIIQRFSGKDSSVWI